MAVSDGRPSRRKNPPGILPAAYIRSSTSTVSGKKSIPSRGLELVQVASTCVSPSVSTHAPCACSASFPTSTDISAPPMVVDLVTVMRILLGRTGRVGFGPVFVMIRGAWQAADSQWWASAGPRGAGSSEVRN
jgi:hypothetical protein